MGMYFILFNLTKSHRVDGFCYWKNSPPAIKEVNDVAEKLDWNLKSDTIIAGAENTGYLLVDSEDWEEIDDNSYDLNKNWIDYTVDYDDNEILSLRND